MATILDPTGDPLLDPDGSPITDGAASSYSDLVVADGAVGFWPLTDAAAPFASAVGGPDLALTAGSVTPQAAGLGAGLASTVTLAGTLQHASLPAGTWDGTVGFTLEAWLQVPSAQSSGDSHGGQLPLFFGDSNGNGLGLYVGGSGGGTGSLLQGLIGGLALVPSAVTATPGTAYHLAIQYQPGVGAQAYVNGAASGSLVATTVHSPSTFTTVRLDGDVGYVALYPTALTAGQITDHYAVGTTVPSVAAPSVAAGHLTVHGGTVEAATGLVTVSAAHLTVHGGTVDVATPPVLEAGHLWIHGGTVLMMIRQLSLGGGGRYPIGMAPPLADVSIMDEGGDMLGDEGGDVLIFD